MVEKGKDYKAHTAFSAFNPNVELNPYVKSIIENDTRKYEYFRGEAYKLKGWEEHFCDCDHCNLEYDNVEELFTSKEEAEKYAENRNIQDVTIEQHGFYIKAVRQNDCNVGLFKEELR